jgi:hypothetical protein
LASALEHSGNLDESIQYYREAVEADVAPPGEEGETTLWAMLGLIEHLAAAGDFAAAEPLAIECVERHKAHYGLEHDLTKQAELVLRQIVSRSEEEAAPGHPAARIPSSR